MIPTIDFSKVRAIDGDQQKGFEELVCQLFNDPQRPTAIRRIEGSGGDGGVELIEIDAKGAAISGWQAKYFFKVDNAQWGQISKSIITALKVHPSLTSYTICLPVDLTGVKNGRNGRRINGQWGKWQEVLRKNTKGKPWGVVRLLTRKDLVSALLEKDGQIPGFISYWFGEGVLDQKWWSSHRDRTRAAFHWSYDPSLSVWTPLRAALDAWAETATWRKSVASLSSSLRNAINTTCALLVSTDSKVIRAITDLKSLGNRIEQMVSRQSSGDSPSAYVDLCSEIVEVTDYARDFGDDYKVRRYNQCLERCTTIASVFMEKNSHSVHISSNKKLLIISGGSGTGKSHHVAAFADAECVASQTGVGATVVLTASKGNERRSLDLLNGVCDGCSWSQDLDGLLTALSCEAALRGGYAVLMIDALNEAAYWREWPEALALLLARIKITPRVRIVVTLRPEYQDAICKTIAQDPAVARIFHRGFRGQADRAIDAYMDHYRISRPATVALRELADHPLFLKLFCMAFAGRSIAASDICNSLFGIVGLIDLWIEWLEERLAEKCDVDKKAKIARRSVEALASLMMRQGREHVERDLVSTELQRLHPTTTHQKSLLAFLLGECVIEEHLALIGSQEVDCIRFSFQRLTELTISRILVGNWTKAGDCVSDTTLPHLLGGNRAEGDNRLSLPGCLDILALLFSEKFSTEIFEVMPQIGCPATQMDWYVGPPITAMDAALAAGITSRSHRSLTAAFRTWLDSRLKDGDLLVWNEVIRSACYETHPLSATTWLHPHLHVMPVLKRDAYWSVPLGNLYDPVRKDRYSHRPVGMYDPRVGHSVVKELLGWIEGLSPTTLQSINTGAIGEVALVLCWFFTSSHRFLRDRSSIALAKVLLHHPGLFADVIRLLSTCNDVYVIERVLAALYGAMLRNAALRHDDILSWIQANHALRTWSSDVVIRDYCLSIEAFCRLRSGLPPGSTLTFPKLPSIDFKKLKSRKHLDAKARKLGKTTSQRTSIEEINHSLTYQAGDFTNYCLGDTDDFTQHLRAKAPPSIRPKLTELSNEALAALKQLLSENKLKSIPRIKKTDAFQEASDYLHAKNRGLKDALMVSSDIVQRWMMTDIMRQYIDAGPDIFKIDVYDATWHSGGRESHKAERLGKKYQWISLRSLLSRLCDNYWQRNGYGSRATWEVAPPPHEFGMREIDCSLSHEAVHPQTDSEDGESSSLGFWWSGMTFDESILQGTALADEWRRNAGCCLVKRWTPVRQESRHTPPQVVLSQHGTSNGELIGDHGVALKRMEFAIASFLVKETNVSDVLETLGSCSFMNRDLFRWHQRQMPQWIGEWPWHPALAGNDEFARIAKSRATRDQGILCIPTTYDLLHEPGY